MVLFSDLAMEINTLSRSVEHQQVKSREHHAVTVPVDRIKLYFTFFLSDHKYVV